MDDPITAAVKQAAREAVAREMAEGDRVDASTIAMIRAGHFDNHVRVESAIMGALAAVPVIAEQCAAVADRSASRIKQRATRSAAGHPHKSRRQHELASAVANIAEDIRSLAEKEADNAE